MIGDYEKQDEKFGVISPGKYTVTLSNVTGDTSISKPYAEFTYLVVNDAQFEGKTVRKRLYLTPKTLEKFVPWQLGVLQIWHDVKVAETLSQGVEKIIDASYDIIGKYAYMAEISIENYEGKNGPAQRNNIVLSQFIGERKSEFDEFMAEKPNEPKFDPSEEMPF